MAALLPLVFSLGPFLFYEGDWVKSDDYPGVRNDWELRQFGDLVLGMCAIVNRRLRQHRQRSGLDGPDRMSGVGVGHGVLPAAIGERYARSMLLAGYSRRLMKST